MSWKDYCYYSHGYFIREARQWERTRLLYWITYNSNVDPKHAKKSPEAMMELMTDKPRAKESVEGVQMRKFNALEQLKKLNAKKEAEWKQQLK